MNKRALMLTAATAALMAGPAFGQGCSIDSKVTTPQSTAACSGTITIGTDGSVVITTNPYTTPAITINGNGSGGAADVINEGTIQYAGVGSSDVPLTGIEMVGGNTGGLDNVGKIDFTGAGTNKTGILFSGAPNSPMDRFFGDITQTSTAESLSDLFASDPNWKFDAPNAAAILLEAGSTFKVQGDTSIGIDIEQNAVLGSSSTPSDIDIAGALDMSPSSSSSASSSSYGIEIAGKMNGNINILAGGQLTVVGNGQSDGIFIQPTNTSTNVPGGILNGDINIDGNITMEPVVAKSLTSNGNSAILMGGTMTGNINIGTSGVVSSVGEGAESLVITGTLNGAIDNQGTIETLGTISPATTGGNPQSGSAILIAGDISGGIFNDGPIGGDGQHTAIISALGAVPAINISPTADATSPLVIGGYTDNGDTASLLNRGTIASGSENADFSSVGIEIGGNSTNTVTLTDGILNSGSISASAFTDTKGGTQTTAVGLLVQGYANVGTNGVGLYNTNENPSSPGRISGIVSGEAGGQAYAVEIDPNGVLPSIINQGTIFAEATTTNTDLTNGAVVAKAIVDSSGTLNSITNASGAAIEAFATTLTDNSQVAVAIDVSAHNSSTTPFQLNNQGTIIGDIYLGSGTDNVVDSGTGPDALATIDGKIYFDGNNGLGPDSLTVGAYGEVIGQLYSGSAGSPNIGSVDVEVENGGSLTMLTAASSTVGNEGLVEGITFNAHNFSVDQSSTLNIHYSQNFDTQITQFQNAVIIDASNIASLSNSSSSTANVTFTPDSFIAPPLGDPSATFVVLKAQTLNVSATELGDMNTTLLSTLSYLFNPTPVTCGVAGSGTGLCIANGNELELYITPKTIGADGCKTQSQEGTDCNLAHIPLFGYAATMFPYVNQALGNDDPLGAAVINSVTNSYNAEQTYEDFAPDVSGALRADAISLTDDATNVVAARQRALRQYANQEGDLTLWGQQFVQRLNQDSTSAGPGYTDTGFGFTFGGDEGDPVDGRYGLAFTFFSGDTREKEPRDTRTSSEWYMLTGYTDWRGKGLFLDTQLNLGYTSLSSDRYLTLTEFPDTPDAKTFYRDAYAQHPGELASVGATTGATFDENGTVFTPQLSLDGLVMRQDPYSESGGGPGFNLHVASNYAQSFRAFTGLGIRQDFDFTDFLIQPDILAGYRYDFANGAESVKANFISISNPTEIFEVTGPKPEKGNIVASGGLSITTGAWSLGVNFDYLRANSGNTSEEGSLTLLGRI